LNQAQIVFTVIVIFLEKVLVVSFNSQILVAHVEIIISGLSIYKVYHVDVVFQFKSSIENVVLYFQ
jgi:hypothetical protein